MRCPVCGEEVSRECVDVEIGFVYGPYGCECGWSEDPEYNLLSPKHKEGCDQWGYYYPTVSNKNGGVMRNETDRN